MVNFWVSVNKVIEKADILLLVLDARFVEESRNSEIEKKVGKKPLIYVITKCDLVDKKIVEKYKNKLKQCIFVSSTEYHGIKMLKEKLLIEAKRDFKDKERVYVGVLGYPNVGKSSLINAINGRSAASTSITSGHTKGAQMIRSGKIMFLDTPGVIPYMIAC
jgi:hypothetical protein